MIEAEDGAPLDSVEPLIGIGDLRARNPGARLAPAGSRMAADFENIGEVGPEMERNLNLLCIGREVSNAEPLVTPRLPQEFRTRDVDRVPRQLDPSAHDEVGIGQVHGEGAVVVLHRGAEQQRAPAVDQHAEVGDVARVLVKDSLRAPLAGEYVSVVVENAEGIAMLERPRPAFQDRRCRRYVELHRRSGRRRVAKLAADGSFGHGSGAPSP